MKRFTGSTRKTLTPIISHLLLLSISLIIFLSSLCLSLLLSLFLLHLLSLFYLSVFLYLSLIVCLCQWPSLSLYLHRCNFLISLSFSPTHTHTRSLCPPPTKGPLIQGVNSNYFYCFLNSTHSLNGTSNLFPWAL